MSPCKTCGIDPSTVERTQGALEAIRDADPPGSPDSPYEECDLRQAKALYALSHLIPLAIESVAIAIYTARMKERRSFDEYRKAAEGLGKAAQSMFGPTKDKTGNEYDDLDGALSDFHQASSKLEVSLNAR